MIRPIWICWCLANWIVIIQGQECGISIPKSNNTVGGNAVTYVKYPWYAGLFLASNPRQLVCGGTLITPKHVLTAAHCFKPFFNDVKRATDHYSFFVHTVRRVKKSEEIEAIGAVSFLQVSENYIKNGETTFEDIYIVKLGISNLCTPNGEVHAVNTVFINEKYFDDLLYFDIAILELDDEVASMPCCLPKEKYESNNRSQGPGIIFGFGKKSANAWRLPCTPTESKIPIQSDEDCKKMLEFNGEDPTKFQGAFCAGFLNGTVGTCQGDSGGPLQITDSNDTYTILGISSFGFGCARKDTFGVYTDVSHYLDWIHNKTMEVQ